MPHGDPDQFALIAMGELRPDAESAAHLLACPACAAELEELRHTAQVGRAGIETLETPSPRVWERIAGELGLQTASDSAPPPRTPDAGARRRPWVWVAAAAAVSALIVGGGFALSAWLQPSVSRVAAAALEALPDHPGAQGSAAVDEAAGGSRTLDVSLESPTTGGYREVWLMTPDASQLISLGMMDGDTGAFVIPHDVDLDRYSLVDVSAEPSDGNPGHSGDSIVRGELRFG